MGRCLTLHLQLWRLCGSVEPTCCGQAWPRVMLTFAKKPCPAQGWMLRLDAGVPAMLCMMQYRPIVTR